MMRPSEQRAFGLAAVALVLAPSDRGHRRQAVIGFMIGLSTTVILLGAERDAEVEHQTARDTFGSEKLWAGAANKWRVQAAEIATELAHPLQTAAPRSCTNGSINPPDQRPVGRRFRQADIASRRLPLRNELRRALPSVT